VPHVALIDIVLPKLNGCEIAAQTQMRDIPLRDRFR